MDNSFSVLISVYFNDNPNFLFQSLSSVLSQTLMPSQIVLVKDGCLTTELDIIIENFVTVNDNIFDIVSLQENVGLAKALNEGLKKCKNDIVFRMDSDDICYSNRFEVQLLFLHQNPNISVLGCSVNEFNDIPGDLQRFRKLPEKSEELIKFAKYRSPLNHPSVAFRKNAILDVGCYKHMPLLEDYYLWILLIKKGYYLYNLQEPLLHFRVGNDMVGRRHGFSYLKKEHHFLKSILKIGFISYSQYLISVVVKFPLRLLPKKWLRIFYKKVLR